MNSIAHVNATVSTITLAVLPPGSATRIAPPNPGRRALAVANIGTGLATMGLSDTVAAGQGWPLAAAGAVGDQGGGYEWPYTAVHAGAVWAVSATGTTIAVMEG